jgi:hypothetical protein
MATSDNVHRIHDAAQEVLFLEKLAVVFTCRRRVFVEGDVAAFRTNNNLFPADFTTVDSLPNCLAQGALRPLASVINCGIEQIDAAL